MKFFRRTKRKGTVTRDMHGIRLAEAVEIFNRYLNKARKNRETIEVTFITGFGVLFVELTNLANMNDLDYTHDNIGRIWITFE